MSHMTVRCEGRDTLGASNTAAEAQYVVQVDRYFEGKCVASTTYEPNTAVRHRYPDDMFECDSPVCCGQHYRQQ